jgi:flagellar hook protein FlgE
MTRSLFSAVSGLTNHQTWLDVIGNNIANSNTPGFKASAVVFQDILSQTLSAGVTPSDNLGGINPIQVGLGVTVGSVTPNFLQGSIQTTNRNTDIAIQGDGFFIVANGSNLYYTRAGAFTIDANGNLVEQATGFKVQGVDGDIQINLGEQGPAAATTLAQLKGNLDYSAPDGTEFVMTATVQDSVGAPHTLTVTFTKNFAATAGQWDWEVTSSDPAIATINTGTGSLVFDENGAIASGDSQDISLDYAAGTAVSTPQTITLDFGSTLNSTPMTGLASPSTAALARQDGLASGTLQSFAVGSDGTITGFFSNGTTQQLAQIQLASFNNPSGLLQVGQNHYQQSAASGVPNSGSPGVAGRGILTPGSLEASNVDLAKEFTNMILAQTGFQANARTIQASDQLLQELVNLRR